MELHHTAGHLGLDGFPFSVADEGLGDGRGGGQQALGEIGLAFRHNLEVHYHLVGEVRETDLVEEVSRLLVGELKDFCD